MTAALLVAADVGPIVPLHPASYVPLVSFDRATANVETIKQWFASWPDCGIGVAAWLACLVALDLEHVSKHGADGRATLAHLEGVIGELPPTRTHATKGGGEHRIFSLAPEVTLRSAQERIRGRDLEAPGLDVVAGRAVLRWPPTRGYTLAHDRPIARLPGAWVAALSDRPRPPPPPILVGESRERRYALAALEREALEVADLAAGRNCALTAAAFRLGRLSPPLYASEIEGALLDACRVNGALVEHGERACVATITRGRVAGSRSPRTIQVRP